MRKIPVLFAFVLVHLAGHAQIPRRDITSNDDIVIQTVKPDSLGHPNTGGYLEYLPDDYDTAKRYPLIVFLHGRGERGNGNTELFEVADLGLPNFIEFGIDMCPGPDDTQEECFIVISPQLKGTVGSWGINVINHIFEFAINKYSIDTSRIFLSGHSLGGIGTYNYAGNAGRYNYSLTGIIPVAANSIDETEGCRISDREINVRAYHSEADSTVKFPGGKRSFDNIKNCPSPVPVADLRFIQYESLSHNATIQQAFRESDLDSLGINVYDWLFNVGLTEDSVNNAPLADAGPNLAFNLPIDSVVISGSGTDPDGDDTDFLWLQITGAPLTLSGADSENLILTDLTEGNFSFVLQVSDPEGLSGSDTVGLTLNAPTPLPPVANAGPDMVIMLPQDSLVIDGAGIDPDSDSLFFAWSQISGASVTLSGANEEDLFISGLTEGIFNFILEVTDPEGLSDTDTVQVSVLPEPDSSFQINEKITARRDVRYLEYLPPGYDSTLAYPVLIYFHSDEVEGSDINLIKDEGPLYFITKGNGNFCFDVNGEEQCFIVISPQMETGGGFFRGIVNELYDQIVSDYAPKDIYLTGFDEGGQAIYSRLLDNENDPNRYSGIAVIGARPSNASGSAQEIGTLNPKILIGHGEDDAERSFTAALDYYNDVRLTTDSPDTLFVSFDGASHQQSMLEAFDPVGSESIYEWLFNNTVTELTPPIADAGEDLILELPLDSLVLSGTGMDSDGSIESYLWSQISGDPLTLADTDSRFLLIVNPEPGIFEFRFEVTDNDGLTDADTMLLTLNPEPSLAAEISKKETEDSRRVPYLEYLPTNYDSTSTYPVLIYLHSSEVAGTELDSLKNEGPFYYISRNSENFCFEVDGVQQCFIVIAPQIDTGSGFFRGRVNAIYKQIENDYAPQDIYLTGFDEGGQAIYSRLLDNENNPNRYSGIAVIGARPSNASGSAQEIGLLNPKILIGHGENDAERSFTAALDYYNDIRLAIDSPDTLFVTFGGDNHEESAESAFDPASPQSIYEWLFNDQSLTSSSRISNDRNTFIQLNNELENRKAIINYLYLKSGLNGEMNFQNHSESELLLYNTSGQVMFRGAPESMVNSLKTIQAGIYIYQYQSIISEQIHQKGRIIIME